MAKRKKKRRSLLIRLADGLLSVIDWICERLSAAAVALLAGIFRGIAWLLREKGYGVVNADVTIICQRPKLKDYIEQMRENVAAHLGVDTDCVNVKATTTEKLGFEGEGLGISSHAVACIGKMA